MESCDDIGSNPIGALRDGPANVDVCVLLEYCIMAKAKTVGKAKAAVAAVEVKEAVEITKTLNVPKVLDNVAKLQAEIGNHLGVVSNDLTSNLRELDAVKVTLDAAKARLKEIHCLEADAITADDVRAQIEAERAAWEAEKAADEAERDRKESEYNYEVAQRRRKDDDTWKDLVERRKRDEAIRQEQVERDLAKREADLKAREDYVKGLEAQVAAFPETLRKEVSKQVAIETNSIKRDYEHQTALANKDQELALASINGDNRALKDQVTQRDAMILSLQSQLEGARKDVITTATKALDASSGKQALSAVQTAQETFAAMGAKK